MESRIRDGGGDRRVGARLEPARARTRDRHLYSRERRLLAGDGEGRDAVRGPGDLLRPRRTEEVRRRPRDVERAGMSDPTDLDRDVRITIAECIRDRGAVPSLAEVVSRVAVPETDVAESFGRLAAARVMILRPGTTEILSFNPFAAGQTGFQVRADGRDWSALCAWDAFGR